jgi:hypothetical protein
LAGFGAIAPVKLPPLGPMASPNLDRGFVDSPKNPDKLWDGLLFS